MKHDEIVKIILAALANVNEERAPQDRFAFDAGSKLFGVDSPLDSLSLVSLIVDVETAVSAALQRPVALMDDRAVMRKPSPFKSVTALADYILELANEPAK